VVPTQTIPSLSAYTDQMNVLLSPSALEKWVIFPFASRSSPSYVPIHMLCCKSSVTDQTKLLCIPFCSVYAVKVSSFKRLRPPPLVPIQMLPSRSVKIDQINGLDNPSLV